MEKNLMKKLDDTEEMVIKQIEWERVYIQGG